MIKVIRRITDADIDGGTSEYVEAVSRYGSRGILVDDELNVAMMHVGRKDLYKLPGGGVDPGEDPQAAFLREIKEETGYEAEIIQAIGYIEEHKARNAFMQYSYCYIARALRQSGATQLTASEQRLGLVIQWMTLELAVTAMDHSIENCADYSTLFMLVRDRTILQHAHAISLFESLR